MKGKSEQPVCESVGVRRVSRPSHALRVSALVQGLVVEVACDSGSFEDGQHGVALLRGGGAHVKEVAIRGFAPVRGQRV